MLKLKRKESLLRMTPNERHKRKHKQWKYIWKNNNNVMTVKQHNWVHKRNHESKLIPEHFVQQSKLLYAAMDQKQNGVLELNEIINAFEYIGIKLKTSELRKEFNLTTKRNHINFDVCVYIYVFFLFYV